MEKAKNQVQLGSKPTAFSSSSSFKYAPYTPLHISSGVWILVFKFIGANKTLANCGLVCRKWNQYFFEFVQISLYEKIRASELFSASHKDMLESLSPELRKEILEALELKAESEEHFEHMSEPNKVFRSCADIAQLTSLTPNLERCISAVISLFCNNEHLKNGEGLLSWRDCQEILKDPNYREYLKQGIQNMKSQRIEIFLEQISETKMWRYSLQDECLQAYHMFWWIYRHIEYLSLVEKLDPKQIKLLEMGKNEKQQDEIKKLKMILRRLE